MQLPQIPNLHRFSTKLKKTFGPKVATYEDLPVYRKKLWKHQHAAAQIRLPRADKGYKDSSVSFYTDRNEGLYQFLSHVKFEFWHEYQPTFLRHYEERKRTLAELQVSDYKRFATERSPEDALDRQMTVLREFDRNFVAHRFTENLFDVEWRHLSGFQMGVVSSWRFNHDGTIERVIEEIDDKGKINERFVLVDQSEDSEDAIHMDTLRRIGRMEMDAQLARNPHRFHQTFKEYAVRKKYDHLPEAELTALVERERNRDSITNNCLNLRALGDPATTFCESCMAAKADVHALKPAVFRTLNKDWVELVKSSKFNKLMDDRIAEEREYENRVWDRTEKERYDQFVTELVDAQAFLALEQVCRHTLPEMTNDSWLSPRWGSGFVERKIEFPVTLLESPPEYKPLQAYGIWFKQFWERYGEPKQANSLAVSPGNPYFAVEPDTGEAVWLTGIAFALVTLAVFVKQP